MRREPIWMRAHFRRLLLMLLFVAGSARGVHAQVDEGWGSDAELCPRTVGMMTDYDQEQFAGPARKERETFFWARYKFTAHNQGGLGPIEMAGFFYLSKAQCYWQENKGVFVIFSPVIEYYGPRRDDIGGCAVGGSGGTGGTGPHASVTDPAYDPYSDPYSDEEGCGEGTGGGGGNTGVPYEPGDYTGGGTVDWGTGIGNGGTSACGAEAVVEYICIDIMTEQGWREWSCGYATTC